MSAASAVAEAAPTVASVKAYTERLGAPGAEVMFEDTMAVIDEHYHYKPAAFTNGDQSSAAGVNAGSSKIFSLGQLLSLSEPETLTAFGQHYRDVLSEPSGSSHANIRAFMRSGWEGVSFPEGLALRPRQ